MAVLIAALPQSGCLSLSGSLTGGQTSLSFGNVAIGSVRKQNLTLTNSGAAAITVTKAVASGGGFTVTGPPLPLTLAVGQSAMFVARFAPPAVGNASGKLLITKSQVTVPQLAGGSGSAAPSISTSLETITMTGEGVSQAPAITTQPASQTVTAGQKATFSVASSGAAPLSYQWSKNGAAISGATSASYTTPVTATSASGSQFTVVVSNSAGNATSNAAILTVTAADAAPSITTQPPNQIVTAGQTATFSVSASGTSPLNYQWRKNGTAISGATTSAYATSVTTSADSGSQFTVAVSNSTGTIISNAATLTVQAAGQLTASTTSLNYGNVTVGSSGLLSLTLTNRGALSVSISNVTLSGAGLSIGGVSSGLTLGAGNSAIMNMTFAPSSSGTLNGSVTITSNATNPTVTISLSGTAVQPVAHSVSLFWADSSAGVAGYNIHRSSVSGGPYTRVNSSLVTTTTYTDSTVLAGQTYFYVVTSVDSAGDQSGDSNEASFTIPTP